MEYSLCTMMCNGIWQHACRKATGVCTNMRMGMCIDMTAYSCMSMFVGMHKRMCVTKHIDMRRTSPCTNMPSGRDNAGMKRLCIAGAYLPKRCEDKRFYEVNYSPNWWDKSNCESWKSVPTHNGRLCV